MRSEEEIRARLRWQEVLFTETSHYEDVERSKLLEADIVLLKWVLEED